VFVHHSAIVMDGFASLGDGEPVEFELVHGAKGASAADPSHQSTRGAARGGEGRRDLSLRTVTGSACPTARAYVCARPAPSDAGPEAANVTGPGGAALLRSKRKKKGKKKKEEVEETVGAGVAEVPPGGKQRKKALGPSSKPARVPGKALWVENLPWALENPELNRIFAAVGAVESATCNKNRSGRNAGTASVVFADEEVSLGALFPVSPGRPAACHPSHFSHPSLSNTSVRSSPSARLANFHLRGRLRPAP